MSKTVYLNGEVVTDPELARKLKRERRDLRLTPDWVFERLNRVIDTLETFWADPCPAYYLTHDLPDALQEEIKWPSPVYVNPPGSLKTEFAEKWLKTPGPRCYAFFDWDHSTALCQKMLGSVDVTVFLKNRWKCEGPDAYTGEWRVHDVGRCQALMFCDVSLTKIQDAFGDAGTILTSWGWEIEL